MALSLKSTRCFHRKMYTQYNTLDLMIICEDSSQEIQSGPLQQCLF